MVLFSCIHHHHHDISEYDHQQSGISVGDKAGYYSLSEWEECPTGSAVCGIRFFHQKIINLSTPPPFPQNLSSGGICSVSSVLSHNHFRIIFMNMIIVRTRVQEGETDAVSNLGQTEIVLHCCQIP